jgi:hypothetical protein
VWVGGIRCPCGGLQGVVVAKPQGDGEAKDPAGCGGVVAAKEEG